MSKLTVLNQTISNAVDDAMNKCVGIRGKDVVIAIGCTGSGKTTVSVYSQGIGFKYSRGDLVPEETVEGFEIGGRRASVTRGLSTAMVPDTGGLLWVDVAGTGDTAGIEAEVRGAIYRSAVLQAARSVRVVLVMKLDRVNVGNDRGKHAIRDVEHVSALFKNVNTHLDSIGLIVTSDPTMLVNAEAVPTILGRFGDAMEDFAKHAVSATGFQSGGEIEGMKITPSGEQLLQHFNSHCQHALRILDDLPDSGDTDLISKLIESGCNIFPVNVLQHEQRMLFKEFLTRLAPVKDPKTALTFTLPHECESELQAFLNEEFSNTRTLLADKGKYWASDEALVSNLFNLIQLSTVLEEKGILPWAAMLKAELSAQLATQHQHVVSLVLEGVSLGNASKVEGALFALTAMDQFRKRIPTVELRGWDSLDSIMKKGVEAAEEAVAKMLPVELVEVKWDPLLAKKVFDIFTAVEALQEKGRSFLTTWAKKILANVKDLQVTAASCASPLRVVHALNRLIEHKEHLPNAETNVLCKYGGQQLVNDGLSLLLDEAKENVKKKLKSQSEKMVEERRQSQSSSVWDDLQQFCKSTELNALLNEDLETLYMMEPLSAALAPSQEEIDALHKQMQSSQPEEWYSDSVDLANRVTSAGSLGLPMVKAGNLQFEEVLDTGSREVARLKDNIMGVIDRFRGASPQVPPSAFSVASFSAGHGSDDDFDTDDAEDAMDKLVMFVPLDPLSKLFGRAAKDTAAAAIKNAGWAVKSAVVTLLRKARKAKEMNFIASAAADAEMFHAMQRLKAPLPFSQHVFKTIQGLKNNQWSGEDCLNNLPEQLREAIDEADNFIQEVVKKELETYSSARTDAKGWFDSFSHHIQSADKLRRLSSREAGDVLQELQQKTCDWRRECLSKASEAAKDDDNWQDFIEHGVRQGLAFEESPLLELLRLPSDFRSLVNEKTDQWQRRAENAMPADKLAIWQILTSLMNSLKQLGSRNPLTVKLCEEVTATRSLLDADLNDGESRFLVALQEDRYDDACQCLSGIQNSKRHREKLKQRITETMDSTMQQLSNDGETDEIVQAARNARNLMFKVEKFARSSCHEDAEIQKHVQGQLGNWKAILSSRTEVAREDLQLALEGRRLPKRALAICSALNGKSQSVMAEEAISELTSAKAQTFPNMSFFDLVTWVIRHDGARRSMPEELGHNSLMEGLVEQFLTFLKTTFKKEQEALHAYQGQHKWADAKQLHQRFRDAVDTLLELSALKPDRSKIKRWFAGLGVGGGGATRIAKQEVQNGEFRLAICALVTGDDKDTEELCEAINAELAKNMHVLVADKASLHKRVSILEKFLEAVGDHPPDELRGLWGEVRAAHGRTKPLVDEHAGKAVKEILEAASDTGLDVARLARALAQFRCVEGAVDQSKMAQLENGVRAFWQQVKAIISKVGKEIEALELQALSLSLEPLRQWLQSFSQLQLEERQVLLHHLQAGTVDLQAWMRDCLAEPCQQVVDAKALQKQWETRNFSEISRRCKIAEKLQRVLGTDTVDLAPINERLHCAQQVALKALSSGPNLKEFNTQYKILKSVSSELPEANISSQMDEVMRAFKAQVLDARVRRIGNAQDMKETVDTIVDLRKVANEAPDTHEDVTVRLQDALQDLQNKPDFNVKGINLLGSFLGQNSIGRLVISEHTDVFGAAKDMQNNALFRRAGETNGLDDVVGRLTRESCIGGEDWQGLKTTLERHEQLFEINFSKYLCQDKNIDTIRQEAKQDLDAVAKICSLKNRESCITLLAHLAVCYTVVRCGKEFLEAPIAEKTDRIVKPHRAQMLTIFRLLHIYKDAKAATSYFSGFFSKKEGGNQKLVENHLAQVLTGEGKCLTLGLLATFLALNGVGCDVVCYRKFLTEQDRHAMLPFYKFVGVEDKILYATFDELCHERLDVIKRASKELVFQGQASQTKHVRDVSGRALLIDEVDVLFGRRFYGQTWDGGFTLDSPEAVALVRYVFGLLKSGRPIGDITRTQPFRDLLSACPPEMQRSLTGIALLLVRNSESWATPEPHLNEQTGQIGYKENDDINYDVSYSNKTVFAYLNFEMEGKLTTSQAEAHLGLDLLCGRFSFAELPKQYCCILGVTGTLRELLQFDKIRKILEQEYAFKHWTYAPSIFGERRLTFREAEHVNVLDNEADWLSSIESVIEDERKRKNAVLVFFKNQKELRKFPSCDNFECLTETVDPKRRAGYVAAATMEGKATLLTRAFGRGIDFQMPEGHQLVVLQTFLSSLISEQTQIKGRTARQGKPGLYRLVLCAKHLEAKMGFKPEDIQRLKAGNGEEIKNLLMTKQQQKTERKAAGMRERREKAAKLEQDTRNWEALLFQPDASGKEKLTKLAEWNGNEVFAEVHYTLLLDCSWSMSGNPWNQLTKAFQSFIQELLRNPEAAATTTVSVILFSHMAKTIEPNHARVSEVQDIGHLPIGGGTDFGVAFEEGHKIIGRSPPYAKEIILFLTDGGAQVPRSQISALLADHKSRIESLTCVAFGSGADATSLKEIGKLFQNQQVGFRVTTPNNQASLVQTFVEAAQSRAIHK